MRSSTVQLVFFLMNFVVTYTTKNLSSECWSRRIDQEHRIVYRVKGKDVVILSCRYHY